MKANHLENKYFFLLLSFFLLMTAILPFSMSTSFHDSQRLITILATTTLLSTRFFFVYSCSKLSLISLFFLILWGGIVSFFSLASEWSLVEVSLFLSVALTILFIFEFSDAKTLRRLVLAFAFIQSIYIARNLLNYAFTVISGEKLDVWDVIDGFSNIRFYAQFLSWTLPFIIGYIAINPNEKYHNILIAITILSWMLVLMSGTRAFIFGMLFSVVSIFLIIPVLWKRYIAWVCLTGSGGAIGYIALIFVFPTIFGLDNSNALNSTIDRDFGNSSGRVQIWVDTLNVILSHPYLGIGPMMTAKDGVLNIVAHPHNFPLQLMAEWGVPFTAAFVGLTIYLTFKWKGLINKNQVQRGLLALPVTAAVSSAAAAGLVDGLIVMPVSLFYMSIILGFGNALWRTWTPHIEQLYLPVYLKTALLVPIWALSIFTVIQWNDIASSNEMTGFSPRFWQNGKIHINQSIFSETQVLRHNVVFK